MIDIFVFVEVSRKRLLSGYAISNNDYFDDDVTNNFCPLVTLYLTPYFSDTFMSIDTQK